MILTKSDFIVYKCYFEQTSFPGDINENSDIRIATSQVKYNATIKLGFFERKLLHIAIGYFAQFLIFNTL